MLLLATGAVSACGDEDRGSTPNAKSEFIRQAARVCQEVRRRDAPLRNQLVSLARPGTPTARYLARGGRIQVRRTRLTASLAKQLRELEAPAGDRLGLERYLAGLEQVAALQARLADAAGVGDRERYDALTEELNPIAYRTAGIAQGYGFRICGSSVG